MLEKQQSSPSSSALAASDGVVVADKVSSVVPNLHVFSLPHLLKCLNSALTDSGVQMRPYLDMYEELLMFISSLGRVFSFASSDLKQKTDAVHKLMNTPQLNIHYETVESMVEHELKTENNSREGIRNFLWLHRALQFVSAFFDAIVTNVSVDNVKLILLGDEKKKEDMSKLPDSVTLLRESYSTTLSNHHGWITQKIVYVAALATPTTQQLISAFAKGSGGHDIVGLRDTVVEIVQKSSTIYDRLQGLFENKGMVDFY